jgi:hypothetical protein
VLKKKKRLTDWRRRRSEIECDVGLCHSKERKKKKRGARPSAHLFSSLSLIPTRARCLAGTKNALESFALSEYREAKVKRRPSSF